MMEHAHWIGDDMSIEDRLDAHFNALADIANTASDPDVALDVAPLSASDESLFSVAELLNRHFVFGQPQAEPDAQFLGRLKADLLSQAVDVRVATTPSNLVLAEVSPSPTLLLRWRRLPNGYRVVASIGGLLLTAALTLLAAHRALQGRAKATLPNTSGVGLNADNGLTLTTV
jgi:hypothetical protein